MTKLDARSLNQEKLKDLREFALYLHEKGHSVLEIAECLGVHRITIGHWLRNYRLYGTITVSKRPSGRKIGAHQTLTRAQTTELVATFLTQSPKQAGLIGAIWSKNEISQLILKNWGIDVKPDYVARLLRNWRFPSQKPPQPGPLGTYENILTGHTISLHSALQTDGDKPRRRLIRISIHPLEQLMMERLRAGIETHESPPVTADDLQAPHILICAHDSRGKLKFRSLPAPATATMRLSFLRALATGSKSPITALFSERFAVTQSGNKWLKQNTDHVLAIAPSLLIRKHQARVSSGQRLSPDWNPVVPESR